MQQDDNSALVIESTSKERHIVAKPNKFLGQIGNDPLSAAVKPRRNALDERSYLRNFHNVLCSHCEYKQVQCDKVPNARSTLTVPRWFVDPDQRMLCHPAAFRQIGAAWDLGVTPDQDSVILPIEQNRVWSISLTALRMLLRHMQIAEVTS